MSRNKKLKFLFFTPHADDIELGSPFMYLEALRLGHDVVEVLMTENQFGTMNKRLKGKKLQKIREKELENANKVFETETNNTIKVIQMGYIDGYLPFNKKILQEVIDIIETEKANIIFAPDPWFAQDFHPDHINTGRLVYFAAKNATNNSNALKYIFYYYSFQNDFYFKCNWKDFKIIEKALSKHASQFSPLNTKIEITFYNKLVIFFRFLKTGHISESYRIQKFHNGKLKSPEQFSFFDTIKYSVFSSTTLWGYRRLVDMRPEELGLTKQKKEIK
ncbi:MAG: PIG-L family deacetylase [Promethearchaeota archaeon]|nr:MAG: PIG-L family deacetylase [Candidatus Lokiarchaeota archaeon]